MRYRIEYAVGKAATFTISSRDLIDWLKLLKDETISDIKVPLIYQIGNCVFRQIPLVMVMYTVMAIALLPFIYKSFRRYGNK